MSFMALKDISHSFLSPNSEVRVEALQEVSFGLEKSKVLTLVGPSGCGKTTLLRIVGGLLKPTSGNVLIDGQRLDGPHAKISMVFQDFRLLPWRTARQNVELPLELSGVDAKTRWDLAKSLLNTVGLEEAFGRYPHELSGGMKQRVGLARALITDPEVLLMDEPFGALDAQTRELLQIELLRLWHKSRPHKTVLFVTHSVDEAVLLSDEIIVMKGRPGSVKERIEIDLPDPRWSEGVRESSKFLEYRQHIWRSLMEELTNNKQVSDYVPNGP